jgi:hypothetical protein
MSNKPYNVYYNNFTGRVVFLKKNQSNPSYVIKPYSSMHYTNDFDRKLQELAKSIHNPEDIHIDKNKEDLSKKYPTLKALINSKEGKDIENKMKNEINKLNKIYSKDNLVYGIKKTIVSDFNHIYYSANNNDFKIGLNNNNKLNIFDTFYLSPNISEINTKKEINIINEKRVEAFVNKDDLNDKQYFPIDFIPCGNNIPLKTLETTFKKLIIKNIYWNIFQSINSKNYQLNELLCIYPCKNEFIYKPIQLQVNFELHSQISSNGYEGPCPYRNSKIKYPIAANSCLYKVFSFTINKLNGSYFENIEIDLSSDIDIDCAILCLRISVPDEETEKLKGYDKNENILYGNIPFSQFIVNFDYDLM